MRNTGKPGTPGNTGKENGDIHNMIRGGGHGLTSEGSYQGQHGFGPQQGQGHFGSSARISDAGSHGAKQHGRGRGELGSHSGARRNRPNPGPTNRRDG